MAKLTRYDPFGELMDDFLKGFFVRPVSAEAGGTAPRIRIEVSEQPEAFKVHAELPGVKKDDIQVAIDGDQVSITAEVRKDGEQKQGERVIHSERYYGKVSRAFRLGHEIDEAKAAARYADGVLELSLPKRSAPSARRISVQ